MTTAPDTAGDRSAPRMSVAAEMEAVFAPLPQTARAAPDSPPVRPVTVRGGHGWRWAASFVAAVLVAATVLIFMARPIPVALIQSRPRGTLTVPIAPAPTARVALAPSIATPSVAAPYIAAPPPATRLERPKPNRIAARSPGRCPASATEAWCRRAEVVAADDRLRDAYDEAVRAGIGRDILVGVRNDWARLRGRANRDPAALIRGYGELTRQLYAELRRRDR